MRGPGDLFDSLALVQGGGNNAFVARQETLCHRLPRDLALRRINRNPRVAAFFYLDISTNLEAAAQRMSELDVQAIFVRDGERVGIVTKTDLADAVILRRLPLVGDIAQHKLIDVGAEEFVTRAVTQMTRHNKRRLAVEQYGDISASSKISIS